MRVEYKPTTLAKIHDEIDAAKHQGMEISYIALTSTEWHAFHKELKIEPRYTFMGTHFNSADSKYRGVTIKREYK